MYDYCGDDFNLRDVLMIRKYWTEHHVPFLLQFSRAFFEDAFFCVCVFKGEESVNMKLSEMMSIVEHGLALVEKELHGIQLKIYEQEQLNKCRNKLKNVFPFGNATVVKAFNKEKGMFTAQVWFILFLTSFFLQAAWCVYRYCRDSGH